MKAGFYPKLAWNGIHKNHRMYFPYPADLHRYGDDVLYHRFF